MSTNYIPVKVEEWVKMVEATKVASDLLAENKRLRKAGDELYLICQLFAKDKSEPARKAWYNALKEGRNAK